MNKLPVHDGRCSATSPTGQYATWVFDCDGVLLDSNGVKSDAMYQVAAAYSEEAAEIFVNYHRRNGGLSRFSKFEHLFKNILKYTDYKAKLSDALALFAILSEQGVVKAIEVAGLRTFLRRIRDGGVQTFVVSGGAQEELRRIFTHRGLDIYFDGIFGSPDTKTEILNRELANGTIKLPAIFSGDSRLDHEAAEKCGLDFQFVKAWTDFDDWQDYFREAKVEIVNHVTDLPSSSIRTFDSHAIVKSVS
jgi:phosphoglycolate phosphatase-like HAD superfamily hydrolase